MQAAQWVSDNLNNRSLSGFFKSMDRAAKFFYIILRLEGRSSDTSPRCRDAAQARSNSTPPKMSPHSTSPPRLSPKFYPSASEAKLSLMQRCPEPPSASIHMSHVCYKLTCLKRPPTTRKPHGVLSQRRSKRQASYRSLSASSSFVFYNLLDTNGLQRGSSPSRYRRFGVHHQRSFVFANTTLRGRCCYAPLSSSQERSAMFAFHGKAYIH